ncbi:hypothetical protein ACROSR_13930 [Roseovarius tibetensis]|uniref:hypothetical protein n=1 Tax=Roseovarius tibetensis TaxID=2685897 RepID=UPI003D7F222E
MARKLDIINAGEVWQTFRSVGLVNEPGFDGGQGRWARVEERATKNSEIVGDPFWSNVLARVSDSDPYAALLAEAGARAVGLVDCSKTDRGLARYDALRCRIVVVHTIRSFSSWAASMRKYQWRLGLPVISRSRLLISYVRINRRMRKRYMGHDYVPVFQEQLDRIDTILEFPSEAHGKSGQFLRAEMFGTPNFTSKFDSSRSTEDFKLIDRILFYAVGVDPLVSSTP